MESMAIDSPMDTTVTLATITTTNTATTTNNSTTSATSTMTTVAQDLSTCSSVTDLNTFTQYNNGDSSPGNNNLRPLTVRRQPPPPPPPLPRILTTQASDDDFNDLEIQSNASTTSTMGDISERSSGGRSHQLLMSMRVPRLNQISSSMPSLSIITNGNLSSSPASSTTSLNSNDGTSMMGPSSHRLSIDTSQRGNEEGAGGKPLRSTPSLTLITNTKHNPNITSSNGSKRLKNAKNLSLLMPITNRSYHSAPNSPPGTPATAHPGLLSMTMARRDEMLLDDDNDNDDNSESLASGRLTLSSLKPRGPPSSEGRHRSYSDTPIRPHTALTEEHREQSLIANDPYHDGPVCILPNLYLGTEVNAANQDQLRKLGIRYILNVAKEVPVPYTDDMLLLSPRSERAAAAIKAAEDLQQHLVMPSLSVPTPPPRAYFVHPKAHPWHGVTEPNLLSVTTSYGGLMPRSRSLSLEDDIDVNSLLGNSSADSHVTTTTTTTSNSSNINTTNTTNAHTGQNNESIVVGVDKPAKRPNVDSDTWDRMTGQRAFEERFRYKKFNWGHNQEDLLEFFENAFSFIDQGRSRGNGVLVHCQCGVSRSASLVLAYVMRNQRMQLHEAYTYVKDKSSAISPNMSLFYQLVEFERKLGLSRQYSSDEEEEEKEEASSTTDTKKISSKRSGPTSPSTAELIGLTTENSPSLLSMTTGHRNDRRITSKNTILSSSDTLNDGNSSSSNSSRINAALSSTSLANETTAGSLPGGMTPISGRERRNSIWRSVSAQHARALSTVMEDIAESQLSPITSPRTPCEACDEDSISVSQKFFGRRVMAK